MQAYPEKGPEAVKLMMETYFPGALLAEAWVAVVADPQDKGAWTGGRWDELSATMLNGAKGSLYVNTTTIWPGKEHRTGANSHQGLILCLDDVGKLLDKEMVDTFAPEPTFVVETSPGNYQYQYGFDPPAPLALFGRLKRALKRSPWREGIKDASGDHVQYVRLAGGNNNKPGLEGFLTRLEAAGPKYEIHGLARRFGIDLAGHEEVDEAAWKAQQALGARLDPSDVCPDLGLLGEIVEAIPNDSRFDDVIDYMAVLYAIKGAGGEAARGLAMEWAYQREQDPVDDPDERWDRLKEARTGLGRLIDWVQDRGLAASFAFRAIDKREGPPEPFVEKPSAKTGLDRLAGARGWLDVNKGDLQTQGVKPAITLGYVPEKPLIVLPGFERGEATIIYGRSEAFKSMFVILTMLAIVAERPDIAGRTTLDYAGDCILITAEDSIKTVMRRLLAACVLHGIDPEKDWKHAFEIWEGKLFKRTQTKGQPARIDLDEKMTARLAAYRTQRDICVIAPDTLSASVDGGSEETNNEHQQIGENSRMLAQACCASVAPIHHTRKMALNGKTDEDAALDEIRGGGALGNSVRAAVRLKKLTKEEARTFGISEQARREITSQELIKRSSGEPKGAPVRFRLHKVALRVREPLTGALQDFNEVALAVENGLTPLGEVNEAWRKLKTALDAGVRVVLAKRDMGAPDSANVILGRSVKDTNDLVAKMAALGWVAVVKDWNTEKTRKVDYVTYIRKDGVELENVAKEIPDDADESPY